VEQLVEDDKIGVGEPGGDLAGFALRLLLFKSVDEFDRRKEPTRLLLLDGLDADCGGEMRLTGSRAANQDDIVRILQELASVELTRKRLVDLAAGGKVSIVRRTGALSG
jgi:hypothetical protein